MNDTYLQTVIEGCAWCKSVIDVSTHEVENREQEQLILLSHGICLDCNEEVIKSLPSEIGTDGNIG